jgi:excisionase family DNA binding protein
VQAFAPSLKKRGKSTRRSVVEATPSTPQSQTGIPESLTLADRIERMEGALTAEELARLLNVSRITIFKQAKAGRIPSFRIGTCVRFDPRAVANWLRRQ